MRDKYLAAKNIKSQTKATKKYMLSDLFFIVIYVGIGFICQGMVADILVWPFHIFNILMAITLISKSKFNPGKRYYHTVFLYLQRNITCYHPIKNISKDELRKDMLNEIIEEKNN